MDEKHLCINCKKNPVPLDDSFCSETCKEQWFQDQEDAEK